MHKKRILILGAGISGLATAWYLKCTGLPLEITILEKSDRVGGWLHTDHTQGFHFEKGPRLFQMGKSPALLELLTQLKMHSELVKVPEQMVYRYLWYAQELHRFPQDPFSFFLSPITKGWFKALCTEWAQPVKHGDETVWEFALRRFNHDVARRFFDPLVVGIFGGDVHAISVKACFPQWKRWEECYGSITKGFFKERKNRLPLLNFPNFSPSSFFSLRGGMDLLPQTLIKQLDASILYHHTVQRIEEGERGVQVETNQGCFVADALFCALPVQEAARLFQEPQFCAVPSVDMAIVNVGYSSPVLPVQGLGYLTPTYLQEEILGVFFDSCVCPMQNRMPHETRLTIKLEGKGKSEEFYVERALEGIRRQLGIYTHPQEVSVKYASCAIPQYGVGHLEKMGGCLQRLNVTLPHCTFVGNYLAGVSVDQCIAHARKTVQQWVEKTMGWRAPSSISPKT